jgi:hypothetical protein
MHTNNILQATKRFQKKAHQALNMAFPSLTPVLTGKAQNPFSPNSQLLYNKEENIFSPMEQMVRVKFACRLDKMVLYERESFVTTSILLSRTNTNKYILIILKFLSYITIVHYELFAQVETPCSPSRVHHP